jgi:predicted amidophosphoribosyltransferase
VLADLLDLVFPVGCGGCGRPGPAWCGSCAGLLDRPMPHRPRPSPPGMPSLWVAGQYEGEVRSALLAYKERGRRELAGPFGAALAGAVRRACPTGPGGTELVLIPVPSRRSVARARGGDHVRRLAHHAATTLSVDGLAVVVVTALRVRGRPRDSAGLSAAARSANLAGVLTVTSGTAACSGRTVVVVDDLVTTGATLVEAARALRDAKIDITAAAAVAATPRRPQSLRRDRQRVSGEPQPD